MRRVLTATLLAVGIAASTIAGAQAKSGDAGNMAARGASTVARQRFRYRRFPYVKSQYKDIVGFTRDMVGESHNPLLWAVAVLLCVSCVSYHERNDDRHELMAPHERLKSIAPRRRSARKHSASVRLE